MGILRRRDPKLLREAKDLTLQSQRAERLRQAHDRRSKQLNRHHRGGHGRCYRDCNASGPHFT